MGKHIAYVIWGESPEDGTTPCSYEFKTAAELDAFWLGVDQMDGWMGYHPVDSLDYRWSSGNGEPVQIRRRKKNQRSSSRLRKTKGNQ